MIINLYKDMFTDFLYAFDVLSVLLYMTIYC